MIGRTTFTVLCLAMYACTYNTGTSGSLLVDKKEDVTGSLQPGTSHTGRGRDRDQNKGPVGTPGRHDKDDDKDDDDHDKDDSDQGGRYGRHKHLRRQINKQIDLIEEISVETGVKLTGDDAFYQWLVHQCHSR